MPVWLQGIDKPIQHLTDNDYYRLDDEEGILVTGGVDADNRPLASVEFFSIPKQVKVTTE